MTIIQQEPHKSLYYLFFDLLAKIARELTADFVKSTDLRLRRLSSDILTKRSAAEPFNVGIAFTYTAIVPICLRQS